MGIRLVISTAAFFVFSHFLKRWADDNDLPKGMTRTVSIITVSIALSYALASLVDWVAS
jgi:hypothetical protein